MSGTTAGTHVTGEYLTQDVLWGLSPGCMGSREGVEVTGFGGPGHSARDVGFPGPAGVSRRGTRRGWGSRGELEGVKSPTSEDVGVGEGRHHRRPRPGVSRGRRRTRGFSTSRESSVPAQTPGADVGLETIGRPCAIGPVFGLAGSRPGSSRAAIPFRYESRVFGSSVVDRSRSPRGQCLGRFVSGRTVSEWGRRGHHPDLLARRREEKWQGRGGPFEDK